MIIYLVKNNRLRLAIFKRKAPTNLFLKRFEEGY